MRAAVLILMLAPCAAAAPVPRELKNPPALQGTWEVVTMHTMGQEMDMYKGARWKIGQATIDIEYPEAIRARYPSVSNTINRVDRTPTPKHLDYTNYQGADRKAIYEVEGDKLTICIPMQIPDRPKGLAADETNLFYTFRRVKE